MGRVAGPLNLDPDALVREILAELTPEKTLPPALARVPPARWQHGVRLAGLGKAAVEQVEVTRDWFTDRGIPIHGTLAVTKHGYGTGDRSFPVIHAAHPICDETSRAAAAALRRFAEETPGGAAFVLCLSGGGSALAAEPRPPFTFEQKIAAFRQLVDGGASIAETNLIRREMSAFKNGGLRIACGERPVVTLITVDVPHPYRDEPYPGVFGVVASGPTIHEKLDPEAIGSTARKWLDPALAAAVVEQLDDPARERGQQRLADACHPDDEVELVASWMQVESRSYAILARLGLRPIALGQAFDEPLESGLEKHLELLRVNLERGDFDAQISTGEMPSRVLGSGKGGRNSEFVVRMARALFLENRLALDDATLDRITVLSLATDGGDGPTDAAGGWLNRAALRRGLDAGADLERSLANSDTLTFLEACGTAFRTGPTATNLMDLHVVALC